MSDIYTGLAIVGLLALAAFLAALRAGRSLSCRTLDGLSLLSVIALLIYAARLWDHALLTALLPFSNVIVVGNWFPVLAGFQAGITWRRIAGSRPRRVLCVAALFAAAGFSLIHPLRGSAPECGDRWVDDICMQTTGYTCSAASAATLLRRHGIEATEQEMAELCLTRRGTTWLGLFRGLKRKTAGTGWDVEVLEVGAGRRDHPPPGPMIISVELNGARAAMNPDYQREAGWIPDQPHSVVLLGTNGGGEVEVADPVCGRETWTRSELRMLWKGRGMRLVRRAESR